MATYYAINAGGNWSNGGTWSTVSAKDASRTGGATQPTSADTCILDDYSGNVTVNTTTCVAKDLNCTTNGNYAGTLTFTSGQILGISTAGSVVFASTMTLAGTGTLNVIGTVATLTSAGLTFPGNLTFTTNGTKTLIDNWTVTGLFTSATNTQTINRTDASNGNMTLNGGMTLSGNMTGTSNITLGGGTITTSFSTITGMTINLAGDVTISTLIISSGTVINYVSGTITTMGSILRINQSVTLNTSTMSWGDIVLIANAGSTITLGSDLLIGGKLSFLGGSDFVFSGNYNITCDKLFIIPAIAASSPLVITLPNGKTLTTTSEMYISTSVSNASLDRFVPTIKSTTASTTSYFVYSGTVANCMITGTIFTDIDASGSAQGLDNWYGGTLTRTSGITNRTSADIGGGGTLSDVFGIIG